MICLTLTLTGRKEDTYRESERKRWVVPGMLFLTVCTLIIPCIITPFIQWYCWRPLANPAPSSSYTSNSDPWSKQNGLDVRQPTTNRPGVLGQLLPFKFKHHWHRSLGLHSLPGRTRSAPAPLLNRS